MKPDKEDRYDWWLPIAGIIAFAAILTVGIGYWTWYGNELQSPDRYSPWKESVQSSGDGSMDLAANFIPQWTPDGQTILISITRGFRYTQPPPSASVPQELIYEGSIYSVEALTGETNRLSTVRGPVEIDASPQISPDGSQYAHVTSQYYEEGNRNFEMAISDVDGPEITRITQDLHYIRRTDTHPKWSPDGSTLAFVKRDAYRDDLTPGSVETINTVYTVPAQGGEPVPLFPTADQLTSLETRRGYPNVVDAPVWSPNSRQIAIKVHGSLPLEEDAEDYIRYESLLVVDRNSGEAKEVLRTDRWKTSIAGPLTWSPNGRELTFIRGYPTNYLSPSGPPSLVSVTLEGTETKLGTFADSVRALATTNVEWSPQGNQLLISLGYETLTPEMNGTVVIEPPDTTVVQSFQNLGTYASWSPDGSEIAVLTGYELPAPEGNSPPHRVIHLAAVQADGSGERTLLEARIVENPD